MSTAAPSRAGSAELRRAYRREIQEAIEMGATDTAIRHVLTAFRGQHPDVEDLRIALQQYVDPRLLAKLETDWQHRCNSKVGACPTCVRETVVDCCRLECPGNGRWPTTNRIEGT